MGILFPPPAKKTCTIFVFACSEKSCAVRKTRVALNVNSDPKVAPAPQRNATANYCTDYV